MEYNLDVLEQKVNILWREKDKIEKNPENIGLINEIISQLSQGIIRVAEKKNCKWVVNEWIKKAILLFFSIKNNNLIANHNSYNNWFDKIGSKFTDWNEENFSENLIRAVPGCYVREATYIGKNTILMPCFINVGANIGNNCMIDTWVTIGSCAQIGANCHISGGVGIGGVLEPLQANPVIIEDNCFIGARSEVAEGVIIGEGSVLGMGVFIGSSTRIINRETGEISFGYIPPYSVVVAGGYVNDKNISTYAAIIIKQVDDKTRSKTSINELLRS